MNEEWFAQSKIFLISPLEFISKRVVSKRPCIETNGFLWDKMEPTTSADLSLVNTKHLEKDLTNHIVKASDIKVTGYPFIPLLKRAKGQQISSLIRQQD